MAEIISIENVSVRYPLAGGRLKTVLSGIDVSIEAGEFVTLAGQTGCGKSTLLRLLLGAEQPSSGRVLIEGLERPRPDRHRGYVPQRYSLFPDRTVLENIIFGLELEAGAFLASWLPSRRRSRRRFIADALQYLRDMGLHETDAGKYPDQLSGGMQQRVAIAQALIMKPRILLMDEAFSALDPGTRTGMQNLIRRVWKATGTTIVFVTHNMSEAISLGSRVIVLAKQDSEEGSCVALDLALPDHGATTQFQHSEEYRRLAGRIEDAIGHSAAHEEELAVVPIEA